jgi:hypothetical protein
VIYKSQEWGGHDPRWVAAPQKKKEEEEEEEEEKKRTTVLYAVRRWPKRRSAAHDCSDRTPLQISPRVQIQFSLIFLCFHYFLMTEIEKTPEILDVD